jgi:ketosteroid isomerase-like protein
MTAPGPEAELLAVVRDWDAAMIRNDADEIGRYMAEDWILIGSDGARSTGPHSWL